MIREQLEINHLTCEASKYCLSSNLKQPSYLLYVKFPYNIPIKIINLYKSRLILVFSFKANGIVVDTRDGKKR